MSKIKSGLILMGIGIGMNLTGRVMASQSWVLTSPSPLFIGFFSLLIIASLVVGLFGLFGLFRLIVGLLGRKKHVEPLGVTPPSDGVWPPAPKPPNTQRTMINDQCFILLSGIRDTQVVDDYFASQMVDTAYIGEIRGNKIEVVVEEDCDLNDHDTCASIVGIVAQALLDCNETHATIEVVAHNGQK